MSPLQWASGMRWTAFAVASPKAMAAPMPLMISTSFFSRAFSRSSWAASRLVMRRWSIQEQKAVMAVGMPSSVTRPPIESSMTMMSSSFTL